jgi:hypothetical protein
MYPKHLLSKRLRLLLKDHLAGWSVLREIENEFEAADVPLVPDAEPKPMEGQRRTLVQGYYNGLDFGNPADVRKFLDVLSVFMGKLERTFPDPAPWRSSIEPTPAEIEFNSLQQQLARDGYKYAGGTIVAITATSRLADAKAIAAQFDAAHIGDQIRRIEDSIDNDPALAIGTAKELTESCFKTILAERQIAYSNESLPQLGKKVLKTLCLVPEDIPESAKGAQSIKVMLSNLATIVQGVAEIRSLYGTGHGKEGSSKGLSGRHARLVVGAASALVTFVWQTHLEQRSP